MDEEVIYKQVEVVWRQADLHRRLVKQTPGWQSAHRAIEEYCAARGLKHTMGPTNTDTWSKWVHILSHTLDTSGHGTSHAECELEIAELVIDALTPSPRPLPVA